MVTISLSFPNFLQVAFLVMCFFTIILSCFFIYHWRAYGESKAITTTTTLVYLLGVACLIGGMATAVIITL